MFARGTLILSAAAAAVALAEPAAAQAVSHFKSWTAVCDNLKTCSAFGYTAEDADQDAYIRLQRAAGPSAAPQITVVVEEVDDNKTPATWAISVDGTTPAGLSAVTTQYDADDSLRRAVLSPAQSSALAAALRNGAAVSVVAGKTVASISLSGSSAAMLWIDDRQGRVGTTSALAKAGDKAASGVPPAPSPPLVRAAPAISQDGLPSALPAAIRTSPALKDCDEDALKAPPTVARLGPGQVLWGPACSEGAYNELSVLFVADEEGRGAREIIPPDAQAPNPDADDELMNINYDPKTRTLSAFAKARGLGDCGQAASWVWDGKAFQLLDESVMPDCQGVVSDDWPSLYHAVRAP